MSRQVIPSVGLKPVGLPSNRFEDLQIGTRAQSGPDGTQA